MAGAWRDGLGEGIRSPDDSMGKTVAPRQSASCARRGSCRRGRASHHGPNPSYGPKLPGKPPGRTLHPARCGRAAMG